MEGVSVGRVGGERSVAYEAGVEVGGWGEPGRAGYPIGWRGQRGCHDGVYVATILSS